jgi:hypothetical protein
MLRLFAIQSLYFPFEGFAKEGAIVLVVHGVACGSGLMSVLRGFSAVSAVIFSI